MFSKEPKHYRQAPRTIEEAFGPYAKWQPVSRRHIRRERIAIACGVVVVGAIYGALFYFGMLWG